MFEIKQYSADCKDEWNSFVGYSKNGTFLIDRNYMDYHSDRFEDCSLMIYNNAELYALLPANISGSTLFSHQGLTYGGLITGSNATAAATVTLFTELNRYLAAKGIRKVIYRAIPWIYHSYPAEEDLYAIFRTCGISLLARDISTTITLTTPLKWKKLRTRGMKKAVRNGVIISESHDFGEFWQVLDENLSRKFGVHPVHSLSEITALAANFPHNIKLLTACKDGKVLAGTVVYLTSHTAHTQYISASPEGKAIGALDLMFHHLTADMTDKGYRFLDFGKSTEDCGRFLNESLIYQKEGFGGRGVCYDTYQWETDGQTCITE